MDAESTLRKTPTVEDERGELRRTFPGFGGWRGNAGTFFLKVEAESIGGEFDGPGGRIRGG